MDTGELADKQLDELDSEIATNFVNDVEETFLGEIDGSGTVTRTATTSATLSQLATTVVRLARTIA